MQFDLVEDAYISLANYVQAFIGSRQWDTAGCSMRILSKTANGTQWLIYQGSREERGGFEDNPKAIWDGLDAALFLRDDLLKTTGQRIWGLTFILYPTGMFNITYDHDKPEGYEESDDSINLGGALSSLQNVLADDKPKE